MGRCINGLVSVVLSTACWLSLAGRDSKVLPMPTVEIETLKAAMFEDVNTHDAARIDRLEKLEASFLVMFTALPKSGDGDRLNHGMVRYALHRFFMQHHFWYIRGLDIASGNEESLLGGLGIVNLSSSSAPVIPTILQDALESTEGGGGLNLHELAVLAAAFEDVAHEETVKKLDIAYDLVGYKKQTLKDPKEVMNLISHFLRPFLNPQGVFGNQTKYDVVRQTATLIKGKRWPTYHRYISHVMKRVAVQDGFELDQKIGYQSIEHMVQEITQGFGNFTASECKLLKSKMMSIEGKLPGRIRLSDFYNQSKVGSWKFTEPIDYLRVLGALDETNTSNMMVIIPNYVTSMTECSHTANMYYVCCPNECETMLSKLEAAIGRSEASPNILLGLVEEFSTETVKAPRSIPAKLSARLEDIADHHDGAVPIHGRLFAQWMHHLFPRECPYPQVHGTANPVSPDEWSLSTGHQTEASDEEMDAHIRHDDSCSVSVGPEGEVELPWSHKEELIDDLQIQRKVNYFVADDADLFKKDWVILFIPFSVALVFYVKRHFPGSTGKSNGLLETVGLSSHYHMV